MSDRVLTYDAGKLHFAWLITSRTIEMYELNEAGRPERRIGFLNTDTERGVVEFEQEAFETHCNWFLENAATAEIRVEPEIPPPGDGA